MNSLRYIQIPNPAAGANLHYVQPPNLVSKIKIVRMTLTTAVAVGNRQMLLYTSDPAGNPVTEAMVWTTVQAASLTRVYVGVDDYKQVEASIVVGADTVLIRELGGLYLFPGWTFESLIVLLKAADQLQDLYVLLEDVNLQAPGVVG
jgi:hypothetical protein